MKKLAMITSLFCFLNSCSSKELPAQPTVTYVDINRYMGQWYVISAIGTFVENNAYGASETYSWNEKDKRIDVDYIHYEGSLTGEKKSYPQKAFIVNQETNAEWKVQFFWPLKFSYLIIDLAADYSYTIVGTPGRRYVWIMSRTKTMDKELYQKLVMKIKNYGYDISQLRICPQTQE